ncbi:MAG: trehalose-phosphatase [Acidimicrobiia bacterium]|nr:trehalose-phosphatase [Acidimicrobiia bacterium]
MTDGHYIDASNIDAVIFDTDGVITRTEVVHGSAWEQLFNEYLEERAEQTGEPFEPFTHADYLAYVDGKPRYDGVASFLHSRGIDLDRGTPDDPPDAETVCGLGNRKNDLFLVRLAEDGVEPYETSVELVQELQRQGVGTALISASRNVTQVLAAAGLSDLFSVIVDGVVAADLGIPGKPHPAVFLEAAARLGAEPNQSAIVEDALSGVEAGEAGGFRQVIGVNRGDHAEALAASGATEVVDDLGEFDVVPIPPTDRSALPSALEDLTQIEQVIDESDTVVFFDYDGVLSPIVSHPDLAVLSSDTRSVLADLAGVVTVAVVSGRDVTDVRGKVDLPGIYYAGSHGFDIIGASGEPVTDERLDQFHQYLGPLDLATATLEEKLAGIDGALVERKKYAIAVHYRMVAEDDLPAIETAVNETAPLVPTLRVATGKKIYEFKPDFDWDKGRALQWLLTELGFSGPNVVPMYFGDDTTDEDAFRVIHKRGIGVVVGRDGAPSLAHYALEDTDEVTMFLRRLVEVHRQ